MPQDTLNLGIWDRIVRGWKMTKLGMRVIRADPELMIYTLFSLILSAGVALLVISGTWGLSALIPETTDAASNSNEEDAFAVATLALVFLVTRNPPPVLPLAQKAQSPPFSPIILFVNLYLLAINKTPLIS